MIRRIHGERGFTLLEVLMSAAIFAVGSLGVLAMVTTTINLNRDSREAREATVLANWKLEQLESGMLLASAPDFTGCLSPNVCYETSTMGLSPNAVVTVQTADLLFGSLTPSNRPTNSIHYQLSWTVDASADTTAPGLDRVTVSVFWPRDPFRQVLAETDPGFIDCRAQPTSCHRVDFHTYRKTT